HAPSSTATTGFTNACVDAIAVVVARSSQTYALNPTQEPKTTRYPQAATDRPVMLSRSSAAPSPLRRPARRSIPPPATICVLVVVVAELGNATWRARTDPPAHASVATSSTTTPTPRAGTPSPPIGPIRMISPIVPRSTPPRVVPDGRVPPGRPQSRIVIHSGTELTISAATPDGTVCSAQVAPPFPMPSSSVPVIAAPNHSFRVGHRPPRIRSNANSNAPATRNRLPAMSRGGIVSIANRIIRYVEPQNR